MVFLLPVHFYTSRPIKSYTKVTFSHAGVLEMSNMDKDELMLHAFQLPISMDD